MKKQKVQAKINLEALAGGAFAEKLNEALMQVAENIQNPNTEATTKRQITVNIKFTPNKTRQMVGTQIAVTTKLAATEAIDTQMVMGVNMRTGQIEIAEYDGQIRGQMDLSDFTDADQDPEPEETQAAAPTPVQNPTGKPKEDKNMLIINIVLALVAALLLFGVIGEKDGLRQQNITIAFVAVIVLIIALNRFF